MTTNLLSVIEQLVGARETLAEHGAYSMSIAEPALAAGKQAREQTQGEIFGYVSEHNCEGPFRWQFHKDSKQIYYDNCKFVTAVYTHPQATEPAPIGFNGLTQAETEATMSVRGLSEPAPSAAGERAIKPMTPQRAAYFMERFKHEEKLLGPNEQAAIDYVLALLSAPALPAAAMPVGELTDSDIRKIWSDICAEWADKGGNPYLKYARAILAAARTQTVREPLATNDIRCECCGYMTHQREHLGCIRAAKK